MIRYIIILCLITTNLFATEVIVQRILTGDSLVIQESPEIIDNSENAKNIAKHLGSNLKSGTVKLSGIKIEPFDNTIHSNAHISEYGVKAIEYMRTRLAHGKWYWVPDGYDEKDTYGVGFGYLIDSTGRCLNTELIEKGYSPYYFKNGVSKRFHIEFVGALRVALNKRHGIWDNSERREYYYKAMQTWKKTADIKNLDLRLPGYIISDVGERVKLNWEFFMGILLIIFVFAASSTSKLQQMAYGSGMGEYKWRFFLFKIPFIGKYNKRAYDWRREKALAMCEKLGIEEPEKAAKDN